jgi:hypothetical protein
MSNPGFPDAGGQERNQQEIKRTGDDYFKNNKSRASLALILLQVFSSTPASTVNAPRS